MSTIAAIGALPARVAARLELYTAVPGVELRPVPARPPTRLDDAAILAGAAKLVPAVPGTRLRRLAELTPRAPWVDGVAWLDFGTVEFYRSGETPFAAVGTFHADRDFPPHVRLTLAGAPSGGGNLVTVRAQVANKTVPGGQARDYRMDLTMVDQGDWLVDGLEFVG